MAALGEFKLLLQHWVVNWITSRGKVQHVLFLLVEAELLVSFSAFIMEHTNLI